ARRGDLRRDALRGQGCVLHLGLGRDAARRPARARRHRPDPAAEVPRLLASDSERAEACRRLMLAAGILEPPSELADRRFCMALSEADVDETVSAAAAALEALCLG